MRAAVAVGGLFAALAGFSGCVHEGAVVPPQGPRNSSDGKDLATASDQTAADRLARTRMDLAAAYFGRGQATDALDEVKLALVARPDNPDGYSLRGLIYASLGQPQTAEDSFRKAMQLAPHDGDVTHNYAWFLCQQQRYADADAQFAATLAEPTYKSADRTELARGICQARAGRWADAEHTLSKAYELDPANPVTAVNLSRVLYRNGQYDRALFYVRRVNTRDELVSAQTLWLAAQIDHKLGADLQVQDMGIQLHKRFPNAPETALFDKGRFDE